MKRIPSLDGFRAVSIILVLFCHSRLSTGFPVSLSDIARQAEVGVTIFFVISGFLITYLLLTEKSKYGRIDLKSFYLRRILRIMPVYFLYLVFILLWQNIEDIKLSLSDVVHALTFTINFDRQNWFVGHFWSVSVEEQFYLFWPAMLIFWRKHLQVILIFLIAYSCVARVISYKLSGIDIIALTPFFRYSDAIFIGAFGGMMYFETPGILKHWVFASYPAKLAALCLILLFVYCTEHGKLAIISLPLGNTIISVGILFLLFCYILPSENAIFKLLNHRTIVHIGVLSYSIYIWQEFFFVGSFKGFRTFPFNILLIYFVALASYYLWERPFLNLKKHLSKNKLQPEIQK
jgi:peptidoglycan/LPS O-acetylase OafA/YrhL